MAELDNTDRGIIGRLQYDGRMPYTDIAAELDISEGAVRRRVKRLLASGKLQIVGIVDPELLGWNAAAMIGITVQAGQVDRAARQIAKLPEVSYLFMVSGAFDLFAEVFCADMDHFVTFLNQKLQKIKGVERTQTFTIMKMFKLSYRWGEAEPPAVQTPTVQT